MASNFDLMRRLNYKNFPSDETFQVIQSKFYQNVRRDFIEMSFMRHRLYGIARFLTANLFNVENRRVINTNESNRIGQNSYIKCFKSVPKF